MLQVHCTFSIVSFILPTIDTKTTKSLIVKKKQNIITQRRYILSAQKR